MPWSDNQMVLSQDVHPRVLVVRFVNNNPEAFKEAYFDFESLNIYMRSDEYVAGLVNTRKHRKSNYHRL
ncbi:hypothetical protein BDQ17DRAFT_1384820 [Cyathus striatus]|nr:hypothetical protein BDQ17DRAFT_1384820 [Cyathus striatus]